MPVDSRCEKKGLKVCLKLQVQNCEKVPVKNFKLFVSLSVSLFTLELKTFFGATSCCRGATLKRPHVRNMRLFQCIMNPQSQVERQTKIKGAFKRHAKPQSVANFRDIDLSSGNP